MFSICLQIVQLDYPPHFWKTFYSVGKEPDYNLYIVNIIDKVCSWRHKDTILGFNIGQQNTDDRHLM